MLASLIWFSALSSGLSDPAKPPIYIWLEPEWFADVRGSFAYWPGPGTAKPSGVWAVAGPGISAEWTQGGESEWNSMGVPAEETAAVCQREFIVPRAGKYRAWVRYVDHRHKSEPFRVSIEQSGAQPIAGELGVHPVVPPNDEYQMYWGFSFGWGSVDGTLAAGPARIVFRIDRPGDAWRQVDAVLISDDLAYEPVGREKPPFAYQAAMTLEPAGGAAWRGDSSRRTIGGDWKRPALGGRDFSMWLGNVDTDPKWWGEQKIESLSPYEIFFQSCPPHDIRTAFQKQFAGRSDVPVMKWSGYTPGFYLGASPDLSPGTPIRRWLERTRTPFFIMTNYATGNYNDSNGPATFQALTGPLADQFLGYIHGEAVGTQGVRMPDAPLGPSRRTHVDSLGGELRRQQAQAWSQYYKTNVPADHWNKGISCLSVDSIALAHLFHESGARTVGYEIDATNMHVPMRIAFERGAARQYGNAWINYASGNFGDACNYFSQQHLPRGAPAWFHSKYAITDGVSIAWYRKLYYLNFLAGASAIYWEQGLANQYILPGPGTHPIQLSPFGRATEDFQAFVDRLPDRGEPVTPIGILLDYGHGYERVNYGCKMLHAFPENRADIELRELFNVLWYPAGILEGQPIAPDLSMPSGRYGDCFDVLVDRPARARAIFNYPILWAAGDVDLPGLGVPLLREYVAAGGTLVLNVESARHLPADLLGVKLGDALHTAESWSPAGAASLPATPYQFAAADLAGATPLAHAGTDQPLITRHAVGSGAVILSLIPRMIGLDERAHPALPFLANGLTDALLPVDVRLADGSRPAGEIMYQVNRTRDGYLVALLNNRGIDKTQHGIARVDRRQFTDVTVRVREPVKSAREYTQPRDLPSRHDAGVSSVDVRVHPGDVQVVYLTTR